MSRRALGPDENPSGFPRVSGDEPVIQPLWGGFASFSPRERG